MACPLNILDNIKKKQEENVAQAKESIAEPNKKFQRRTKKDGLEISKD
tara:strand:- start:48 stop:191 length:144 start_codon:yes stop_codon:yes gene_type:complete